MKVGFIGLGNMGQAMAGNLLKAGHELTVYNRTRSAADQLEQAGAKVADSASSAAHNAEVLITMLANDAAVEATILSEEGYSTLETLKQGAIHVSMSTISVALSQKLAKAHQAAGQAYLAAPVFGRPDAAAAAKLWIVAGGESELIERCRPLFDAMGQGVLTVGEEPWTANLVKLTGNFMIVSMLEALSEAFALMQKSGVEPQQFLEIVNTALFKSPLYEKYGSIIVEERYEPASFKLNLGLKDVRLVLEAAEKAAVPMPLASLIRDQFLSGVARGHGEIDWAGLGRVSAENAGISPLT
ncbi:NAD(P)-dependent oxidoreductase [Iningainema sp. BLCCT55]|uniref:NAD(P)-dependent oxidoreductase n=2 Tax=Iningainema TaxID=1932705 RepID=A0A8J6XAR2_9CYAN|nr:NAD(P)-dependent oxidoreductase [Iningainema tapete BLCC-T55]